MSHDYTDPRRARDPLAEFIAAERDRFDAEAPPAGLWGEIAEQLGAESSADSAPAGGERPPLRVVSVRRPSVARALLPYWRHVAVACMLLTIGLLSGMLLERRSGGGGVDTGRSELAVKAAELEGFYQRELDRRLALVASYRPEPSLNAELGEMVRADFRNQTDLRDLAPGSERFVLQAMAQEYQAKLDALDRVVERLRAADNSNPRGEDRFQDPGRVTEEL